MRRRPSTSIAHVRWIGAILGVALCLHTDLLLAQQPVAAPSTDASAAGPETSTIDEPPPAPPEAADDGAQAAAPEKVEVTPVAGDEQIAARLQRILAATPWFENPRVEVDEGVVFLRGRARTTANKEWAGQLASKTEAVVAVVNLLEIIEKPVWDLSPAWGEIRRMGRFTIQSLPGIVMAAIVLAMTWVMVRLTLRGARHASARRVQSPLLRDVVAKAATVPVILLGLYLAMQVSGLTRLAATVLGGTGIIGLVIGIAFRDIAENFLASILISIQRPFLPGDLILVADQHGYVEKVTSRGTVIMTLEGNHVQVPNSTIYKSIIRNYTANPNTRLDFVLGLNYADDAAKAQEAVRRALAEHDAVLADPEPLVLVEEFSLAPAFVKLHAYFWINAREHSALKVRSAVMRLANNALQSAGLMMPDVPRVAPPTATRTKTTDTGAHRGTNMKKLAATPPSDSTQATSAEGELRSEKSDLRAQAANSRELESGTDLLKAR